MKRILIVALALVMVLGLFSACGGGSPSAATTPPAAGGDETVYTLNVTTHCPESIPPGAITGMAAQKATELSNGRLQFNVYYSGNFVAYNDAIIGTADKVVDIAMVDASLIAQTFVANQVFSKPLKCNIPERSQTTAAFREYLSQNPELNGELETAGIRWLACGALAGYNIHTNSKLVQTPADLKGMKIESIGDAVAYFTSMGAAATAMDPGDYYSALEKGLIDGQATHWAILGNFATMDFQKNHTIFGDTSKGGGGLYAPTNGFIINAETWNSLPEDLQQILEEAFYYGIEQMIEMDVPTIVDTDAACQARGDKYYYVTGEELQVWYDWMDVSNAQWFAQCTKAGYDGETMYNNLLTVVDSYN